MKKKGKEVRCLLAHWWRARWLCVGQHQQLCAGCQSKVGPPLGRSPSPNHPHLLCMKAGLLQWEASAGRGKKRSSQTKVDARLDPIWAIQCRWAVCRCVSLWEELLSWQFWIKFEQSALKIACIDRLILQALASSRNKKNCLL